MKQLGRVVVEQWHTQDANGPRTFQGHQQCEKCAPPKTPCRHLFGLGILWGPCLPIKGEEIAYCQGSVL